MVSGIGVDIVNVGRMRSAVERWGERFLRRVFTDSELAYAFGRRDPSLPLAARFAAKEALIKAIGPNAAVSLIDIEVCRTDAGMPFLEVRGSLQELFARRGIARAHLSMSHEREFSVACVVLEARG